MFDTVDPPLSMQNPDDRILVRVYPMEFWTEYREGANGPEPVDWVKWAKPGSTPTVINEAIPRLSRPLTHSGPMGETMFHPAWPSIKPAYEAWKRGEEAPVDGVPLDAWPALDKRASKALKGAGIKTVEDFANVPDAHLGKLMVPNARQLRNNAKHYLEARTNGAPVAAAMAEQDEKLAAMQRENAELKAQMAEMLAELRKQPGAKAGKTA